MINVFVVKKWVAFIMPQILTVICFFIGIKYYNLLIALACMGGGLLVGSLLGSLLIANPFTKMLEGKGILLATIDSTGVVNFFNVAVKSPYISGKIGNKYINDVFDRNTVFSLANPKMALSEAELKPDGGIKIDISAEELNKSRFGLFHYPMLIWNSQINGLLTKDYLSDQEKQTFAEHTVLYLNRKMEELTSSVRDFGRHVVELTRPQEGFFARNKWIIIVIIIIAAIILLMFAPHVINLIKGGFGFGDTVTQSLGPKTVNPIV